MDVTGNGLVLAAREEQMAMTSSPNTGDGVLDWGLESHNEASVPSLVAPNTANCASQSALIKSTLCRRTKQHRVQRREERWEKPRGTVITTRGRFRDWSGVAR